MQTFQYQLGSGSIIATHAAIKDAHTLARTDWERDFLHDLAHDLENPQKLSITKPQRQRLDKILSRPARGEVLKDGDTRSPTERHLLDYLERVRYVGNEPDLEAIVVRLIKGCDDCSVQELEERAAWVEKKFAGQIDRCRPLPRLSPWAL